MEKSYTNYYIPLITPELKLSNAPIKHKGRIKLLVAKTSQRLDSLMPHGFADCAKENKIYKDLCSNFHIDLMTKDEIVEELQRALSNHLPELELSSIERDRSMPDVSSISENMFEILCFVFTINGAWAQLKQNLEWQTQKLRKLLII